MLEYKPVNLQLTKSAKDAIQHRLVACDFPSPIPGITWGRWEDESSSRWQIGFSERDKLIEGWIFKASGLAFYTFQDWVISQLDGKRLDYVHGKFSII